MPTVVPLLKLAVKDGFTFICHKQPHNSLVRDDVLSLIFVSFQTHSVHFEGSYHEGTGSITKE